MSQEISEDKLNFIIKCLVRIHGISDADAVERFKTNLKTTRLTDLMSLIEACQPDAE